MLEALVRRIAREVSGERALETVRSVASFHRVQSSPGYDGASDWLAGELERAGLEVEIVRVPGDGRTRCLGYLMPQGWACERATATLHGDGPPRVIASYAEQKLSLILRSAPARGRFPVVALEDGTEPGDYDGVDVRGRVVMTRGDVHRVHRLAVIERGAAGLLSHGRRLLPPVRTEDTDPDAIAYTSFWWGDDEPRGWGFAISPGSARHLLGRLAAGASLELEVEIDSRAFDTMIPLLSGVLRGPQREGAGEVLIVSHLCHPQPSANDNASGVAANLEAARALAAMRRVAAPPAARHAIRHLWVPEFTGTYAWLGPRADRAGREIVAALNLDMVGEDQAQCGSTFLLEHPPCWSGSFAETLLEDIRQLAVERLSPHTAAGRLPVTRMAEAPYSGGSDHTVFIDPAFGVPCPMLIEWPDRFYHSTFDTTDRTDPGSLALTARCAAAYAAFVAAAGLPESEWLATRIARRARSRLLDALSEREPARRVAAERLRASAALASLARLEPGADPGAHAAAARRERDALDRFCESEILPALAGEGGGPRPAQAAGAGPRARVPVRSVPAPLHYQRWLIQGWEGLPEAERERWRAAESGPRSLATAHELAWSLADGARDVEAIARLVWLESGVNEAERLEQLFEWTAMLGLSEWRKGSEG